MKKQGAAEGNSNPFEAKRGIAIPSKYNNPEESGLNLNVAGGNQEFDIKLN